MLDRDKFEELQVRADGGDITDVLDIEQDVKPLAEKCITLGCKVLLLKCGAKGMYLQTAGEEKLRQVSVRTELDVAAWAEKAVFEKSYIPEKILSGTGAGDTSIAHFLLQCWKETLRKCVCIWQQRQEPAVLPLTTLIRSEII